MENFADRLVRACTEKDSIVVVGIDPRLDLLPPRLVRSALQKHGETLEGGAEAFTEFGRRVIDAVGEFAVAVKCQAAFFETLGPAGMEACRQVMGHAHQAGLMVIADVKRSDIASTAEAYAQAYLGEVKIGSTVSRPWGADAVTVNPYLGSDGLLPFIRCAREHGGGVFVLVKTSNPSSGEIQDLVGNGRAIYERVGEWVAEHAEDLMGTSGYSSLGAVVGATYPEQLARLRELMPRNLILIPGYGTQGGAAADVQCALDRNGLGAVVNASRSVIFAYRDETWSASSDETRWTEAVREAARRMRDELNEVRR
jgi:orotidine-5'-phosphate decarboxylase